MMRYSLPSTIEPIVKIWGNKNDPNITQLLSHTSDIIKQAKRMHLTEVHLCPYVEIKDPEGASLNPRFPDESDLPAISLFTRSTDIQGRSNKSGIHHIENFLKGRGFSIIHSGTATTIEGTNYKTIDDFMVVQGFSNLTPSLTANKGLSL